MAKITVAAVTERDPAAIEVQEMLGKARESIQQLAHHLASQGTGPGVSDVDNWLRAERQLYAVPSCELVEQNGAFRLRRLRRCAKARPNLPRWFVRNLRDASRQMSACSAPCASTAHASFNARKAKNSHSTAMWSGRSLSRRDGWSPNAR